MRDGADRMRRLLVCFAVGAAYGITGNSVLAQSMDETGLRGRDDTVFYDWADDAGRLSGGSVRVFVEVLTGRATIPARVTPLGARGGRVGNRISLVAVGDGYTEAELAQYAEHVDAEFTHLFEQEPFYTYAPFFNTYRVDVISNESGVDNDPVLGIERDTALDMGFWCNGIERLLCVNVAEAYAYASNAPAVDMVLAVANSTKYGGAGYAFSKLATVAGGHPGAAEIALHEFGHGLGNLADEYDANDGSVYTGPEVGRRNVSILTASEMAASGTKWAPWLGYSDAAFDGLQYTFEGAYCGQYGIYRPTVNSKMRTLGRPFNLPSAEAMVIEMYRFVRPIDDSTPTTQELTGTETVYVTPVSPIGHALDVQWYLDDIALSGAIANMLDLTTLPLTYGMHGLAVTVADNTSLVRDSVARDAWLTETRVWTLVLGKAPGDVNCDGVINYADINPFVLALSSRSKYQSRYPNCIWLNADCNGDSGVTYADINPFVRLLPRHD